MDKHYTLHRKSRRRSQHFDINFFRNRSTSEPDLSDDSPPQSSRWLKRLPHEYISVDQLGFHRRKKLPELSTKSDFCLYNKSEPSLPYSALKTEYQQSYTDRTSIASKPLLFKRPTSLRLQGAMSTTSEQRTEFRSYPEEDIMRSRQLSCKYPENLRLTGEVEYIPEYTSAYVAHPISGRPQKHVERKTTETEDALNENIILQQLYTPQKADRQPLPKCQLKLEGELTYVPEYRSKYVEFPIEKSHSIPQISSIKFHGKFTGIPEYSENFKSYDNFVKSAPLRKPDNLNLKGVIESVPEYKARYKEPDKEIFEKRVPVKKIDHFEMKGEFSKSMPEYNASFKDYHITAPPQRGKCRETFFDLRGEAEFNPEYRCTYLDFPRSRPITIKPSSHFKLSADPKTTEPPRRFDKTVIPNNIHDGNSDKVPFEKLPEYRKAKIDYIIKERTPSRDRLLVTKAADSNNNTESKKKFRKSRSPSPSFRLMVENVDDVGGSFRKSTSPPRYGRRAMSRKSSPSRALDDNADLVRNRTTVIEGNPKYVSDTTEYLRAESKRRSDDNDNASSFVVLNEPCKQSAWMKPKWYDT